MRKVVSKKFSLIKFMFSNIILMLIVLTFMLNLTNKLYPGTHDVFSINILIDAGAPVSITDLIGIQNNKEGSIKLNWTAPVADLPPVIRSGAVESYIIEYASFSVKDLGGDATKWWNHSSVQTIVCDSETVKPNKPGILQTFDNISYAYGDGIFPGVTYYFAIRSKDTFGNISDYDTKAYALQASVISPDYVPKVPNGINTVVINSKTIKISWNDMMLQPGYLDFDYYKIYRSTSNKDYILISTTTLIEYTDLTVMQGTTYYYKISAVDKPPVILESEMSLSSIAYTPPLDMIKPIPPMGIKLIKKEGKINISWRESLKNEDGTEFNDKAGYKIYRSKDIENGWIEAGTTLGNTNSWTDETIKLTNDDDIYYYKLRAIDIYGNESEDSRMIYDTSAELNAIAISKDKRAIISIPQIIGNMLYRSELADEDIYIEVETKEDKRIPQALSIVEYKAMKTESNTEIKGFKFDKARAKIKLKYKMENNNSGAPNNQVVNKDLGLFWNNGVEWVKVRSEIDNDTLTTYSSRLGSYMIKSSIRSNSFIVTKVYPRTFTPDGDNRNDYVEFLIENPADGNPFGKIYDLRGALVGEMKKGGILEGSLIWDGRTISGETAPAGVYIYQIEVTGQETKTVNGIVVLAK